MKLNKYKNIEITSKVEEANCITHSGKFHVDDVISTIFISKIKKNVSLIRVPSVEKLDLKEKLVYDIGLGEFDHHQKDRNGQRENGIYYSSIGLLWKKFGEEYLKKIKVKNIEKVYKYMDNELIQYIDATDNMQMEYLENKIMPDFVKLCNPQWNETISGDEAFVNALKLADDFWNVYIKNCIAEIEATEIILDKIEKSKECYVIFDREMPYRKAIKKIYNDKVKYLIFKSNREGYDIRVINESSKFNTKIVKEDDIRKTRKITGINELIYIDINGKLCCTKTLESAIEIIEYNENCKG